MQCRMVAGEISSHLTMSFGMEPGERLDRKGIRGPRDESETEEVAKEQFLGVG